MSIQYDGPVQIPPELLAIVLGFQKMLGADDCPVCRRPLTPEDELSAIEDRMFLILSCDRCGFTSFHTPEAFGISFHNGMIVKFIRPEDPERRV